MVFNKQSIEKICYISVLAIIIINAYLYEDSIFALISAVCGISYTFFAGKGKPYCYIFGVIGSGFYGLISWQSAIWGNLLLYILYYIPMQIAGFFKWRNNLKQDKSSIVKININLKELVIILSATVAGIMLMYIALTKFGDSNPVLDSITTVFSISAMYLTVRRAIEQWLFWIAVNALSLVMWVNLALSGAKVWSTVIMWAVYLFLGIYFYFEWKKEIKSQTDFLV